MSDVRIPNDFSYQDETIARIMFNADVYDWWGHMLNLEEVHKYATGKGVNIAILDTGFYPRHPDLVDNGQVVDFTNDRDGRDYNGHGCHVRGLIGMQPNGRGYVGVAPGATLHLAKVLDGDGIGSMSMVEEALIWVLDNEFDWVNGSLAIGSYSDRIVKRINQMKEKGIGCTFAAGNDFKQRLSFPASLEYAIAVGAHDAGKLPGDFSNTADSLQKAQNLVLAPGVHVHSSWIDGNYKSATGSSMACPITTGLCALIIELERNFGGDENKSGKS